MIAETSTNWVAVLPDLLVIDIGGTSIKLGLVNKGGPADHQRREPTGRIRTDNPIEALARIAEDFAAAAGSRAFAVIVTIPGFIDHDFDRVLHTPNVPELEGHLVATELAALLGTQVVLERDAILLLEGERQAGAVMGCDHVLGVFFGTGVGAAFSSGDQPFRGGGWALEIGHMPLRNCDQPPQIVEDLASGRVLFDIARRGGCEVEDVFELRPNSGKLDERIHQFIRDQATTIGAAMALMSPKTIVLGGGVMDMPSYPRDLLERLVREQASPRGVMKLDVRWAMLGWRSVLYGASKIAESRLRGRRGSGTSGVQLAGGSRGL